MFLLTRLQVLGHILFQETFQDKRRPGRDALLQHQHCASCISPCGSINRQTDWQCQDYGIHAFALRRLSRSDRYTILATPGNDVRGSSRLHAINGHGTSVGLPSSSSAPQRTNSSHGDAQRGEDSEPKSGTFGNRVSRRQRSLLGRFPDCRISKGSI